MDRKGNVAPLIITLLLTMMAISVAGAVDKNDLPLRQVPEKLTLGPIEFCPPAGFWYSPSHGTEKTMRTGFTFYKTKQDAKFMQDQPSPGRDPIIVVRIGLNKFKDFNSYYEAEAEMYRSKGVESMHYFKDLPADAKTVLGNMSSWSCREKVSRGHPELIGIECLSLLDHYGVLITGFCFNEKKVIDIAPVLKSIMMSVREVARKENREKK